MNLPALRRIVLPMIAILAILAAGSLRPVLATASEQTSVAERYVLERVQTHVRVDLTRLSKDERELTGEFVTRLLTGKSKEPALDLVIVGAVIKDKVVLENQEISYNVSFLYCTFKEGVSFAGSHFIKGLTLSHSDFEGSVDFSRVTVDVDFVALFSGFKSSQALFEGMRVGRDFVMGATFDSFFTSFESTRVGGDFYVDESKFNSANVSFEGMRVDGNFSATRCEFSYDPSASQLGAGRVIFVGSHFADFFLNGSSFDRVSTIDFTRMQADFISFDEVRLKTPATVKTQRMTFKLVSPVSTDQLGFLLSDYNAEFYTDLETSRRTHGYPDEADRIFIAKKRAERRENCKSFFHQCQRGAWALSMFEDMLAGYGKSLQNLLYWSLGFLIIGTFVFLSEKGMRTQDAKNTEQYKGRYNAFWYSLDLFLPIIKLGEADVWTPKDDRRWANLYRKVHIIIGSLFVPIGLAAWTGIIK